MTHYHVRAIGQSGEVVGHMLHWDGLDAVEHIQDELEMLPQDEGDWESGTRTIRVELWPCREPITGCVGKDLAEECERDTCEVAAGREPTTTREGWVGS